MFVGCALRAGVHYYGAVHATMEKPVLIPAWHLRTATSSTYLFVNCAALPRVTGVGDSGRGADVDSCRPTSSLEQDHLYPAKSAVFFNHHL
ncbi:hypothetical protein GGP41_002258 [Bipolaris sorokiniana]|uniref:Uncharacterized protein n=1 Tax=Cochliobolus sativus TaxID=45130 RepID=A0A8H5ZA25_COCSA|nr:hypothetical protein GGP41_002258 [Bipolaris sorokiniana]